MVGRAVREYPLHPGDTNQVSFGRGTYASRSAVVGTGALRGAADTIYRERARIFAGFLMEASPKDITFEEGKFKVRRHRQVGDDD